jgi:hypothetical protein
MPFFLIPTALGACFFFVWIFIGGMIFRDSQLAAQRDRESDNMLMPLPMHRAVSRPKMRRAGKRQARFAS